jgi:hypothetical protein
MLSQTDILSGQYFNAGMYGNVSAGPDPLPGDLFYEGLWYGVTGEEAAGVTKYNTVAWASLSKVLNIAKASISKINNVPT